jgi:isoamylase
MALEVLPGQSYPLGATVYPNGVNFCVFSKNCDYIELLLFDLPNAAHPDHIIRLDPVVNRSFYYWHVFVPGLTAGQIYAYRVYGPYAPEQGHYFDGSKVLIDPYARAILPQHYHRAAAIGTGDNCAYALRGVVVDNSTYDWEGDKPLFHPYATTIIYELHVGGFTSNPNSGVEPALRGTYAGLIEKIPYLASLGITSVELLPVQQFDDQDSPSGKNYWGYSPIAYFAPHQAYSSRQKPLGAVDEFRDMVKALHRANIEVILDIVFNHTAEGNHTGPTLSFRGFENRAYYIPAADPRYYADFSGCGNSLNANQSIVRRMLIDCLRYWVAEMHVDGFRFDLASVLARDEWGQPLKSPPILWEIESDPILAGTKIIAEAWDAVGLYQVGSFVGHRWAEWNGQFRDDIRRFVKSDPDTVAKAALRMVGSPDLYPQPNREPSRSINFVTCHDGFTLNDLVSYNEKHNELNGEHNRDGSDANYSWNHGVEGPSDDPAIEALRLRQIKNMFTILALSQGTPMILMGDEVRRTQHGNNNAYCQNNDLSWFDWSAIERENDLLRFVRNVLTFSRSHPLFCEEHFWTTPNKLEAARLTWHGTTLNQLDWRSNSHSLAFTLYHPPSGDQLHMMLNAYWEPLTFELPELSPQQHWCRVIDTFMPSPDDFCPPSAHAYIASDTYLLQPRSVVLLMSQSA